MVSLFEFSLKIALHFIAKDIQSRFLSMLPLMRQLNKFIFVDHNFFIKGQLKNNFFIKLLTRS